MHFVSATRRKPYYEIDWPALKTKEDYRKIRAKPGDVFLGLDYSLNTIRWHRRQLAQYRRDGGQLWFLVHDVLPLERPQWFSNKNVIRFTAWLDIIAEMADGFICNSYYTQKELRRVLRIRYGLVDDYSTCVVPMGSKIFESRLDGADVTSTCIDIDLSSSFTLMVGTLEPRKGHRDVIEAFEALWDAGSLHRLVLIGRLGWDVESLKRKIKGHAEFGGKLLWLDDVDDRSLDKIYSHCDGVIIASYAEGFGLPLIEALEKGKPVLARDIEVFRQHAGCGVEYFPEHAGRQDLSLSIENWLKNIKENKIVIAKPLGTWRDAAVQLFSAIARQKSP